MRKDGAVRLVASSRKGPVVANLSGRTGSVPLLCMENRASLSARRGVQSILRDFASQRCVERAWRGTASASRTAWRWPTRSEGPARPSFSSPDGRWLALSSSTRSPSWRPRLRSSPSTRAATDAHLTRRRAYRGGCAPRPARLLGRRRQLAAWRLPSNPERVSPAARRVHRRSARSLIKRDNNPGRRRG